MLFWSAVLFVLGVAAFMDSLFNYGEIFRQINSVFFLLISLAVLIRTTTKIKEAKMEGYIKRVGDLERKVNDMNRTVENTPF
ncbi:MAG: hypothetical protein GY841_06475 [FCB group bacterium]|nr:hypothetical protein [FCB group bacterium]